MLEELSQESGLVLPETIRDLDKRPVLHDRQIQKEDMRQTLLEILRPLQE